MTQFSELTRTFLLKAGWSEQCRVDTSDYENAFREHGYTVSQNLISELSEFGGLYVDIRRGEAAELDVDFNFDVLEVIYDTRDSVATKQHGKILIPVGECYEGRYKIATDDAGYVCGIDHWGIQEDFGRSLRETIEYLCQRAFGTSTPPDIPFE